MQEAFRYLHDKGYKIIIITARNNKYHADVISDTIFYLHKYNLWYDEIIFEEKNNKGDKAHKYHVDVFIDDKESNLDDINKYGIECLRFTTDNNSKYKIVKNWNEVIAYFKSREVNYGRRN